MNQDAIDQALRSHREITPSPEFARRVMRAVRTEAVGQQAVGFPWLLPAGALTLTTGLTLAVVLTGGLESGVTLAGRFGALAGSLAWLTTALTGSLGLAWWAMRFAGR